MGMHEFDGSEITEMPSMGMSAYPARARQAGQDEGMACEAAGCK